MERSMCKTLGLLINKANYCAMCNVSLRAKVNQISKNLFHYKNGLHTTSNTPRKAQQLVVKGYGDPIEVVSREDVVLPDKLLNDQVLVKFLASPVNPADINTIQGTYAIKPSFPFVPGNEGVMEVVAKGEAVEDLLIGDKIIPLLNALGTWRTMAIFDQAELLKIPSDVDIITASTISVNPCTAFRMLHDFVSLKKDDVIIQNCANSAVGLAVIQIATWMGVKTISIVRDRPNLPELKRYMKNLGATLVLTESELRTNEELKSLPKPLLALNGVGGRSTTEIVRYLNVGGTVVTYGGMSRKPIALPVGSLIFRDITFKGFWMTRWNLIHRNDIERMSMLDKLFNLSRKKEFLPPPHTKVPFDEYARAIGNAMPSEGRVDKKQILIFE